MIEVQRELCIGCGLCIGDCPVNALELEDKKAAAVKECLNCGHCVAICPKAAVAIPDYDMEEVEEFDKDRFTIRPEIYLNAVKFRRSIRNFKDKPIEDEILEQIINAGRYTPTARNAQACTFVVVKRRLDEFKGLLWSEFPGLLETFKETYPMYADAFEGFYERWMHNPKDDPFFFNCTTFLVIGTPVPLDGGLAAANIENMAVAEGAGVLYSGFLQRIIASCPALLEWLGLENNMISCCMLLGYPAVQYRRTAPRKKAALVWK